MKLKQSQDSFKVGLKDKSPKSLLYFQHVSNSHQRKHTLHGGASGPAGGNAVDQNNNNYHDASLNSDLLAIMKPVKDRKFNFGS